MFAYNRLDRIFNYVRRHDYITPERLASLLKITERTIRNDILELNEVLNRYGASVKLKRKYGYYLEVEDNDSYQDLIRYLDDASNHSMELDSSQDRIKYILTLLLSTEEYFGLEELMEEVCISKNTLNNYIKAIKEIIRPYDLEYIAKANAGIKIIGTERAKRKCFMDHVLARDFDNYITGFSKVERMIFREVDLDYLKELTLSYLDKNYIKTSDFNVKNLIIHIALMILRIKSNNYIKVTEIKTDREVMQIVNRMSEELEEHYDIAISKGEKQYLYMHMIANTHIDVEDINDDRLSESIQTMFQVIYDSYNFDLRSDEILRKDLFRHLKSIFASKTYALNRKNPLLDTIKKNYPLAFEVTLTSASQAFVREPYTLDEGDVGYVSLHIGAAIERCFSKTMSKKKVLLVCGSGHATTRMLETRLGLYFQDKINIVQCCSYNEFSTYKKNDLADIDFVISTISIKCDWIPVIVVNFSLTNQDVETISRFLTKIAVNKVQKTGHFFDKQLFFRMPRVAGKEQVIQMLYERMQEQGIANERYLQSVMRRETLGKTNMNEFFALPHPMELCASATKVAVALLDEPVLWNANETVQIVFLLAIKQGVQEDIEHLYDIFIEISNNAKLEQKILRSSTFDEFISALAFI